MKIYLIGTLFLIAELCSACPKRSPDERKQNYFFVSAINDEYVYVCALFYKTGFNHIQSNWLQNRVGRD